VARRAKSFALLGDEKELYHRSPLGILQRCISVTEGQELLREIHSGACGHHAAPRALVGNAFRQGFYWPTAVADTTRIVRTCEGFQFYAKQTTCPLRLYRRYPSPGPLLCGVWTSSAPCRRRPGATRTTAQRLQVTLHFCPDQRAKGAGSHAGGMQPRQVDALLRHPTRPAWRPRPTRHATGAPDAPCKQLHRHSRHYRASSTAEPIPRLEVTQRATQQRQPGAAVSAAKDGPAVMTVAGRQEQRSRRQPSSRPIRGQRENPLSRREDNAPVIRSSNGSRTRNGCPANHSPRRINSAVGQAAPLAGEAGDASPSP
jgi:hypothetical protein